MSRFLTPLMVERGGDEYDDWRLTAPLVYQSDVADKTITVPAGYRTDFASVPRLPVAYWLTGNTAHEAAVVHDWLYSTGQFPRVLADRVLREAMSVTGIPAWRRWGMYWAVRIFGGKFFGRS